MPRLAILTFIFAVLSSAQIRRLAAIDTVLTLDTETGFWQLNDWKSSKQESFLDHAEINGSATPIRWHFETSNTRQSGRLVESVYRCDNPSLRAYSEWQVRAEFGPIEHWIRFQNLSKSELWLPLQNAFQFDFEVSPQRALKQFWVEKGASSPSAQGTHFVDILDGYTWTGTSSTHAHPKKGEPREIIPYVLVEHADETGFYLGIEFSGRSRISLRRDGNSIAGEAGLNPSPGPYKTRLPVDGTYETPTIFIGAFKGGPDAAGNSLRRWIRQVLNNPLTVRNPEYPMLVSNSWGSGMAINQQQAHAMIGDASELGLEMFHLDAGWFRALGDWVSNPEKFPEGVAAVATYAHKLGLKFGLWTDWTQAGSSDYPGALSAHEAKTRDWLTTDAPANWKPAEFKGVTIDIGLPAARRWATDMLVKLVGSFHLDMLEHDGYLVAQGCERRDHPHANLDETTAEHFRDEDFLWVSGSNDTDVSDHATRAYYEIQSRLRRQFPALLLEICNDGGRMVDFGSAAHGDYFSITDAYDPLSNRRAFFDASYVLPPAMLETYVEKWPAGNIENFRYMLRSGMMGWFTLMQDSTAWTAQQHEAARQEFALYKSRLRPLIRNGDIYHISERADGLHWDGIEYFDPSVGRGVVYAFRGTMEGDGRHVFPVRGLDPRRSYGITFRDGSSPKYAASGEDVMRNGISAQLAGPNTSELIFFEQTDGIRIQ